MLQKLKPSNEVFWSLKSSIALPGYGPEGEEKVRTAPGEKKNKTEDHQTYQRGEREKLEMKITLKLQ